MQRLPALNLALGTDPSVFFQWLPTKNKFYFPKFFCSLLSVCTFTSVFKDSKSLKIHNRVEIKVFLQFFSCWRKDLNPDPDPEDPKTYGFRSGTLVKNVLLWCSAYLSWKLSKDLEKREHRRKRKRVKKDWFTFTNGTHLTLFFFCFPTSCTVGAVSHLFLY